MTTIQVQNTVTGKLEDINIKEEQLKQFVSINDKAIDDDNILKRFIDNMNVDPTIKVLFEKIMNAGIKIGDIVYNIGRKVIEMIIYFVKKFPNLILGTIIGFLFSQIFAMIPIVGWLLSGLVTPILTMAGAAIGLKYDFEDKKAKDAINSYLDEIFSAFKNVNVG
jgi:hypothetical protein